MNIKKRICKKKHCGDFTEWARQLVIMRNRKDGFDEFLDAFIEIERIEKSASPAESASGGPLKRNSTGQAGNSLKTCRYNDEACRSPVTA